MSGPIDIKRALQDFQTGHSAVVTTAFVDVSARMVLSSASRRTQAQEILDRLAEEAARVFEDHAARKLNKLLKLPPTVSQCWQSDKQGTRLYLAGPSASGEALVFVLGRSADRRSFGAEAAKLAQEIWGTA